MFGHRGIAVMCAALALSATACARAAVRAPQQATPVPASGPVKTTQWSGDTTGLGALQLQLDSALAAGVRPQASRSSLDRHLAELHQAMQQRTPAGTQDATLARLSLSMAALHQALRAGATGSVPR